MVTLDQMRDMDEGNFAEKMEKGGITDDELIQVLKEKIHATDTKPFNDKGSIVYAKALEAHDIQLKAVDMALKLKGRYPAEKRHHTFDGGVPIVPLSEDEQLELEAMKEVLRQKNIKKSEP